MPKILYIITQADGGGAQTYTLMLAKHFGGAIAAGSEALGLFDQAKTLGIQTFKLKHLKRSILPWQDMAAVLEIRSLIQKASPDIVHLNSTKAGFLGSLAAIGLPVKVVFTAHGFIFNEPIPWAEKAFYIALEKGASAQRDLIICVSEADHKSALNFKIADPRKLITIHNGIDNIEFLAKEAAREKLNLGNDKTIIGCVANFYKTKGVDVLLQAVALMEDEIKNQIKVVVIGDGKMRRALEKTIARYKLENLFELKGKIENAKQLLKAFDIFVLPSRKEGLPLALLEAMRAGLPIVACEVGGVEEVLNGAGILVEPEKPRDLARALESLVKDKIKQKELSAQAAERSKEFVAEKMLKATEDVYQNLLR